MDVEGGKSSSSSGPQDAASIFLASLNEKELIAYNIAKSHLGTMFSLEKCNAFLEWKEKQR
jgi:hypothetical protein